jgi:hypothetical protein
MFLGLPDPDPLVRSTDLVPDPYVFCNEINVALKSN